MSDRRLEPTRKHTPSVTTAPQRGFFVAMVQNRGIDHSTKMEEQKSISDLKFDPRNARKRTERSSYMIRKSLEKFGGMRSIVIDDKNIVRAGNGTLEEAGQIGIERVRIIEADGNELIAVRRKGLSEDDWKEYAIADNRASDLSEWDLETLQETHNEVDLSDWFTRDEISAWDVEGEYDTPSDEEDEETTSDLIEQVESGAIEPRVKLGEIWALGRHRIACGDSTDEANVKKLLGDRFGDVGMVWADAPYGMRLDADFSGAKSSRDFAQDKKAFGGNKYENVIGDHEDFDPRPLLKLFPSKEQFWWGADYYAERLPNKNDGSWFVWDKRVEESMDAVYGSGFELCWSIKKHKRQLVRVKWAGIFGMEKEDTKSRVHPTQKPNDLCAWFFEKYSQSSDLIFDPFLGSAPSIIAAQKMEGDRTVYGFELSPEYCTVIIERFEKFTGKNAELVGHL